MASLPYSGRLMNLFSGELNGSGDTLPDSALMPMDESGSITLSSQPRTLPAETPPAAPDPVNAAPVDLQTPAVEPVAKTSTKKNKKPAKQKAVTARKTKTKKMTNQRKKPMKKVKAGRTARMKAKRNRSMKKKTAKKSATKRGRPVKKAVKKTKHGRR